MDFLISANTRTIDRGYDYYKNDNVISCIQLSDFVYEGKVKGTRKVPYHVTINIEYPKKSSCDCPFADSNNICKHMVALFFSASPEASKEHKVSFPNFYDEEEYYDVYEDDEDDYYEYEDYEEDYYYDEEDEDEYYNEYESDFIKPIFFDEMLLNFVNNLSEKEAKNILIEELKRNEKYTVDNFLEKELKKYSSNKNNIYVILEKLNKDFYDYSHNYDYNNKNYEVKFLSKSEKQIISNVYVNDNRMRLIIDKLFLNPEIATYDDYKWFVQFYKSHNNKENIREYSTKLELFFDTLKNSNINNTVPKSNVLITIAILNDYTIEETAKLLVKNCKYTEYVDYIIENTGNIKELYQKFDEIVENEKYINKKYIAQAYNSFYLTISEDKIYNKYLYYDFLHSKEYYDLEKLKNTSEFDYYINKILKNVKDLITLERIYLFIGDKENLFKLLFKQENEYRLMANIENLKDEYNSELLSFLKQRFYEIVSIEKSRTNYKRATIYVEAISRLNDGKKYVNELVNELRNSEYSRRKALFDELSKVFNIYENNLIELYIKNKNL